MFYQSRCIKNYGQTPLTNTDQVKQIIRDFSKSFEEKHGIKWGIEWKGKEGIIGTIGFQEWSHEHKRAELSYALFPKYWVTVMQQKLSVK